MDKREKVIKGLECHVNGHPHTRCHKCPYWGTGPHGFSECSVLAADALALLKAQEPVEPKKKSFLVSGPDDYTSTPAMTVCGACDAWLLTVAPRAKYCPQCGRAVKWE